MKRRWNRALLFALLMSLAVTFVVSAQNQSSTQAAQTTTQTQQSLVLKTLISAFDSGDNATKRQVMQRAQAQPAGQMAPLYSHALDFFVSNAPQVTGDVNLYQAAIEMANSIAKSGTSADLSQLWNLFQSVRDNTLRIALLNDFGTLGKGDAQTVVNVNSWIEREALSAQAGARPDQQVVQAAVDNLSRIADASSFATFLHVILAQISDPLSAASQKGMFAIKGDTASLAVSAIQRLDISQWDPAATFFLTAADSSESVRQAVAAGVLGLALDHRTADIDQQLQLRNLRSELVRFLTQHPVTAAAPALVRNFSQTVQEFDRGVTTRDRLLESIASLGASNSEAAAQRLSDFMNLLNTYTQNDRSHDMQVVLAVITALKSLGYQVAYQPLYFATLLKYPAPVLQAANDALGSLQK